MPHKTIEFKSLFRLDGSSKAWTRFTREAVLIPGVHSVILNEDNTFQVIYQSGVDHCDLGIKVTSLLDSETDALILEGGSDSSSKDTDDRRVFVRLQPQSGLFYRALIGENLLEITFDQNLSELSWYFYFQKTLLTLDSVVVERIADRSLVFRIMPGSSVAEVLSKILKSLWFCESLLGGPVSATEAEQDDSREMEEVD